MLTLTHVACASSLAQDVLIVQHSTVGLAAALYLHMPSHRERDPCETLALKSLYPLYETAVSLRPGHSWPVLVIESASEPEYPSFISPTLVRPETEWDIAVSQLLLNPKH